MPTQLTTANVLDIAAAAAYLAQRDQDRYPVAQRRQNPLLPQLLYCERKAVAWAYENNVDATELRAATDYLYDLTGKYGLMAQSLTGGAGGLVTVGGATTDESNAFPLYITEANFTSATFYPDVRLANYSIRVYLNEINRLLLDSEFSVSAFGLTILLDGFDATTNTYELMIHKVNG